jgi:hypothetical protein
MPLIFGFDLNGIEKLNRDDSLYFELLRIEKTILLLRGLGAHHKGSEPASNQQRRLAASRQPLLFSL